MPLRLGQEIQKVSRGLVMRRKLEVALIQWLPAIIACSNECEEISSLAIHQYCGRALVVLGPEDQCGEICRVVSFLKTNEYLVQKKVNPVDVQWLGVHFKDETFETTSKFNQLKMASTSPARTQNDKVVSHRTEVANYNFNLNVSVEKLLELSPSLNIDLISGLRQLLGF